MDMSRYREMFLSEAKEHLQKMNALLPRLGENPADREGIDALFREAHSVKGMAASMGYERTAALAHRLEDVMHGFRQAGRFDAAAAGRLQTGFDLLEELLEDIEGDRPEREIAAFLAESAAAGEEPAAAASPPAADPVSPPRARAAGRDPELVVTVRFVAGAAAPAARALLVLRELGRRGEILASEPDQVQLGRGGEVRSLRVQLRTGQPPGDLRATLAEMSDVERVSVNASPMRDLPFQSRREDAVRSVRINTDLLDRFIDLTGEMITNRYILQSTARDGRWEELREALDRQSRLIGDLHHYVLRVRMLAIEGITGRLPRLVRELARRSGKEIELSLEGQEVELDRSILEGLADPLMHLVRNAVDHGIDRRGKVSVRAWREKDQVLVEVADDGRGMDPQVIRRKAVEKGVVSKAQAKAMRDPEVLQLVCLPGFSTAEKVTETSGRGVGMDVVKSAVETLGGSLAIDSAPGQGARFLLKLPVSVAIIHLLLVECAGHLLGIPFTRVHRALEISRSELRTSGRRAVAVIGEEEIPLLSLRKVLGLPPRQPGASIPLVISEARGRTVALVVDRLAGQRQAFIKALSFPLDRLPGVSGATVLGDGSVVFVLDPHYLLEGRPARPPGGKEGSHGLQPADGRAA